MNKLTLTLSVAATITFSTLAVPPPPPHHETKNTPPPPSMRENGDNGHRHNNGDYNRKKPDNRRPDQDWDRNDNRRPNRNWEKDREHRPKRNRPKKKDEFKLAASLNARGDAKEVSFPNGAKECYIDFISGSTSVNTIVVRNDGDKNSVTVATKFTNGQRFNIPINGRATGIRISTGGNGSFNVWYK